MADIFGTGFESPHGAGMESPHNQMRGLGRSASSGGIGIYAVNGTSGVYELSWDGSTLTWVNIEGISSGGQNIHCCHTSYRFSVHPLFGGNITLIGGVGPINLIAKYDPGNGLFTPPPLTDPEWSDAGYESFDGGSIKKIFRGGWLCCGENLTWSNGKQYPVYRRISSTGGWIPYIDGHEDPDSQRFANSLDDDRNYGTMVANDVLFFHNFESSYSEKRTWGCYAAGRFTNSEGTSKIIYMGARKRTADNPVAYHPWKIEPNFSDGTANAITYYFGYTKERHRILRYPAWLFIGGDFDDEDGSASNNALYNPYGLDSNWTIFHRPHGATSVINDMTNRVWPILLPDSISLSGARWERIGWRDMLFASSGTQFGDITSNYLGYLKLSNVGPNTTSTGQWSSDYSAGITGEVKSLNRALNWRHQLRNASGSVGPEQILGNSNHKIGTSIGNSLLAGYDGDVYDWSGSKKLYSGTNTWSAIGTTGGTISGATDVVRARPTGPLPRP